MTTKYQKAKHHARNMQLSQKQMRARMREMEKEISELRAKAEAQAVPVAKVASVCGCTVVATMINGAQLLPGDELCANFDALQSEPAQAVPSAWLDKFGEPHRRIEDAKAPEDETEPTPLYRAPPAQTASVPARAQFHVGKLGGNDCVYQSGRPDKPYLWAFDNNHQAWQLANALNGLGLYTAPPAQAASLTTPTPSVSCVPDEWVRTLSDLCSFAVNAVSKMRAANVPLGFLKADIDRLLPTAHKFLAAAPQPQPQQTASTPDGLLPIQPLAFDPHGVLRFEKNPIVRHLLDDGPFDLNHLCRWCADNDIDDKYQEQFAQLIGYSLSGFSELSYVSDATYERASAAAPEVPKS